MKKIYLLFMLSAIFDLSYSQSRMDSLRNIWSDEHLSDSIRLANLDQFTLDHVFSNPDSGVFYGRILYAYAERVVDTNMMINALYRQGVASYFLSEYTNALQLSERCLSLAREFGNQKRASHALNLMGASYKELGDYRRAIETYEEGLVLAERMNDQIGIYSLLNGIGEIYMVQERDLDKAMDYLSRSIEITKSLGHETELAAEMLNIAQVYRMQKNYQKAIEYYQSALDIQLYQNNKREAARVLHGIGQAYNELGDYPRALDAHYRSLDLMKAFGEPYGIGQAEIGIGNTMHKQGRHREATDWCGRGLSTMQEIRNLPEQRAACDCLYESYKALGEYRTALQYHEQLAGLLDSLQLQETDKKLQQMEFSRALMADSLEHVKEMAVMDLTIDKQATDLSRQRIGLAGAVLGLLLIGLLAFSISKAKSRSDALAEERRVKAQMMAVQAQKLEDSLLQVQKKNEEIVKAQEQIIQQEKLASLGQLTAGIAHEIKNPLNFITNFAESSVELHEEVEQLLTPARCFFPPGKAMELDELLQELKLNAIDIRSHGHRADQIVRNMMVHARSGKAERQLVDLNQLVEENMNLAYHGYRTIESTLSVEIERAFAAELPPVSVFPSDLGRVILNMINNACYTVHEKLQTAPPGYHPTIVVSTARSGEQVLISIRDNGDGIPEAIRNEIFMPFFTTKPPSSTNTGLGLSISYDIVVNRHQGTLKVDSKEGEFAEFQICLPLITT